MRYILLFLALIQLQARAQSTFGQQIDQYRDGYKKRFLLLTNSPLPTADAVAQLRFYPADSAYRIIATVQLIDKSKSVRLSTSKARQTTQKLPYALLSFVVNGQPCQLTVYKDLPRAFSPAYLDRLFLPFTDETTGRETYSGGRYLEVQPGDIRDGKLTLDFNKAYNPYCAYKAGYACPIPPANNRLMVAIQAGEQTYGGAHP